MTSIIGPLITQGVNAYGAFQHGKKQEQDAQLAQRHQQLMEALAMMNFQRQGEDSASERAHRLWAETKGPQSKAGALELHNAEFEHDRDYSNAHPSPGSIDAAQMRRDAHSMALDSHANTVESHHLAVVQREAGNFTGQELAKRAAGGATAGPADAAEIGEKAFQSWLYTLPPADQREYGTSATRGAFVEEARKRIQPTLMQQLVPLLKGKDDSTSSSLKPLPKSRSYSSGNATGPVNRPGVEGEEPGQFTTGVAFPFNQYPDPASMPGLPDVSPEPLAAQEAGPPQFDTVTALRAALRRAFTDGLPGR